MKNLKALCLAFLLLVGTLAQEGETQGEAEAGFICNTEDGEGCQASDYLGLRTYNGRGLRLTELNTSVFIEAPYALVQHTLVYENDLEEPTDLVFYYNKPENSIVSNISASWDNRDAEAELISQEDAEDLFSRLVGNQDAFNIAARGIPAFLVGTVPPGRDVTVQFTIIQPLTLIANTFWGFSLYSTVAADDDFRTRPWNSSLDWDGTLLQGQDIDEWSLNVVISSRRAFDVVLNPTHNIDSARSVERNRTLETWNATINTEKDFVLFFTGPGVHSPQYVFTKHPWLDSDWIFGYTLMPVANNLTASQVESQILASETLAEVDQGDSDSPVLVRVNSSVTCNDTDGDTIFRASHSNGSLQRDQAYEQYFFLRNLVNPDGCRLNITYYNTFTRATTYTRYVFRGFSLARTNDQWHKIAYSEEFEEFENGESTSSNITSDEITDLAIRYQVEAENTRWVTVTEENNRNIVLPDSLRYYFSPEDQPNAEDENAEGGLGGGINEGEDGEDENNQNTEVSVQVNSSGSSTVEVEAVGGSSNSPNN